MLSQPDICCVVGVFPCFGDSDLAALPEPIDRDPLPVRCGSGGLPDLHHSGLATAKPMVVGHQYNVGP